MERLVLIRLGGFGTSAGRLDHMDGMAAITDIRYCRSSSFVESPSGILLSSAKFCLFFTGLCGMLVARNGRGGVLDGKKGEAVIGRS